jgi:hypothetical protein
MSGSVLGGATWHLEMSWGTSPEIALPGHVPREALSGPPDVRCPGRPHTDECGRVQVRPCSHSDSGAVLTSARPDPVGGIRTGTWEGALVRRPVGGPAAGAPFPCALLTDGGGNAQAKADAERGAGNCATSRSRPAVAHAAQRRALNRSRAPLRWGQAPQDARAQHAERGAGNRATSRSRPAVAHAPQETKSQALTRTPPAPAGVSAPRPERSPARRHPCRSGADARSGNPAP